jgi:site-specific recombinase XerD
MAKHSAANARIKREYFTYLKEAQRRDEGSIDAVAKALARFEDANGHKDFKTFHRAQAVAFKQKLDKQPAIRTGKPLSRATVNSILSALRAFFVWLAGQPGYKSRLSYADADYFNLAEKDVRIAKAARHKAFPSLEQVHHVIAAMPTGTAIELRNRALVAFALLTGARDGALAKARRSGAGPGGSRRARREDQGQQNLCDLVFPGWRRCARNSAGLVPLPAHHALGR